MNIGDRITVGVWAGEPIVWKAIEQQKGRFLLLSEKVLEYRPFHPVDTSEGMGAKSYYETNWGSCELRSWLNGEFCTAAFTGEELTRIPAVIVSHPEFYKTLYSFFSGDVTCEDRIFLLSKAEVERYLTDENDMAARLTDHALAQARESDVCPLRNHGAWWLRTTVREGYGASSLYVLNSVHTIRGQTFVSVRIGSSGAKVWSRDVGVRPAMWYQA